jgi:peptidoglycan/LPS O-acetylase OafA/YrhL
MRRWLLPTPGRHVLQLDSLRAFAVLGVLLAHTSSTSVRLAPFGEWGVNLFFVLSGYLIVGILLDARAAQAASGHTLRVFYARRFLRIFPLFYAVVIVTTLLAVPGMREGFRWYVTYLANFHFVFRGQWGYYGSHLWSLSVEEQFYLLAPLVILLAPRRHLPKVLVGVIAAAVAYRIAASAAGWSPFAVYLPPLASFDAIGIGALLAVTRRDASTAWVRWALLAGLPLLATDLVAYQFGRHGYGGATMVSTQAVVQGLAVALIGVWLVDRAAHGFGGIGGRLLNWWPLVYIGTISYGIYIYHLFLTYPAVSHHWPESLHAKFGAAIGEAGYVFMIGAATIAMAAVSWHFFERPLNSLKRFFPYEARVEPAQAQASPAELSATSKQVA